MSELRYLAEQIVRTLKSHGHQAVFAGGCVRDQLLGQEPSDYDIATDAAPDEVVSLFSKTVLVGAKFGVVRVIVNSHEFEVATFRTERGYTDHRRPDLVEFTDARSDVMRRDFTINAMLYDPVDETLLDYMNGQRDLEDRVIRAVGEPSSRFEEDHLRLLRAIRFATRFDCVIEPATFDAVAANAASIETISNERIGVELLKMFGNGNPRAALQLLSQTGLLVHVLPEVEAMKGVEQPANLHPEGDVFQHALLALKVMGEPRSPEFAMGVLLHDVGKPPTFEITDRIRFNNHCKVGGEIAEQIGRRLRMSNEQIAYIKYLVTHHMRFMHVRDMRESTLKKMLRHPFFEDLLELHRIDSLASHGDLGTWEFCKKKREEFSREEVSPEPLITGRDLITLGYKPGPLFKEILSDVEEAQLEGMLKSSDEAVDYVKRKYKQAEDTDCDTDQRVIGTY